MSHVVTTCHVHHHNKRRHFSERRDPHLLDDPEGVGGQGRPRLEQVIVHHHVLVVVGAWPGGGRGELEGIG
jgi:hypothetical protein